VLIRKERFAKTFFSWKKILQGLLIDCCLKAKPNGNRRQKTPEV